MFRLALNAGHGKNTPGKRCLISIDPAETREWILNSRICDGIEKRLSLYEGIEVKRMDDVTGNTDIPISQRAAKANAFGADLYLSIHHNAGIAGGGGGGIMAFTYTSVDKKTEEWQKSFYDSAISHSGLAGNRSLPLGKQDLGECRMTKMPAVLMECGFMDSRVDTPIILTGEFAEKIADACTEVIIAGSGIKKVVNDISVDKNNFVQPPIQETEKKLYRVRKSFSDKESQVGAFTVLENAISAAGKSGCSVFDSDGNCVWNGTENRPETGENESLPEANQQTADIESSENAAQYSKNSETLTDAFKNITDFLKKLSVFIFSFFRK